jgi:hypothetical protein
MKNTFHDGSSDTNVGTVDIDIFFKKLGQTCKCLTFERTNTPYILEQWSMRYGQFLCKWMMFK